jgi:hypothetical protein
MCNPFSPLKLVESVVNCVLSQMAKYGRPKSTCPTPLDPGLDGSPWHEINMELAEAREPRGRLFMEISVYLLTKTGMANTIQLGK